MRLPLLASLLAAPCLLAAAEPPAPGAGAAGMPEPGSDRAIGSSAAAAPWSESDDAHWRGRVAAAGGVAPAAYRTITGERQRISASAPKAWQAGTKLKALEPMAPGALDPASLVIRRGERRYAIGSDVLLDPVWGGLGLAPGSALGPADEVELDYRVGLRRLDALVRTAAGAERIRAGEAALLTPRPAALAEGDTLLATVFVDYHQDGAGATVLPLLAPAQAPAGTTGPARLPASAAKLRAGQPLRIVCWGDSVTEGGNLGPGERYGDQLAAGLRRDGQPAEVQVIAVGGSNSRQWIEDDLPAAQRHPARQAECRFQRILDARADLVVVEFVNDQGLGLEAARDRYRGIIARLRAAGAEVLLLTPQRNWTRDGSLRWADGRDLVRVLRELGRDGGAGVGCADMAGRWEHLWREGIPFPTLLANGFNHPDARGHRLFVEEIRRALGLDPSR